jgi:hypothetical protein
MWNDLARLNMRVRPFDGHAPAGAHIVSRFDSPLRSTLDTLRRELEHLAAENIVVELDVREQDIRLDGYPRSNARLLSPAVRVTFDSRHGPLRYETAEYRDWKDNLRAIALSMESLRKVDRYGVSKRGEQYRGWRALPTGTDPADAIVTREQAEAFLWTFATEDESRADVPIEVVIRRAVRATHPDTNEGIDPSEFRKVMRAKEILGA